MLESKVCVFICNLCLCVCMTLCVWNWFFSSYLITAVTHSLLDCWRQEDEAQSTDYHHCWNAGGHLRGKFRARSNSLSLSLIHSLTHSLSLSLSLTHSLQDLSMRYPSVLHVLEWQWGWCGQPWEERSCLLRPAKWQEVEHSDRTAGWCDEGIGTDCSQLGQSQCSHSESSDLHVHVYVTIRLGAIKYWAMV